MFKPYISQVFITSFNGIHEAAALADGNRSMGIFFLVYDMILVNLFANLVVGAIIGGYNKIKNIFLFNVLLFLNSTG